MRFALDNGFFSPLDKNEAFPSIYDACRCGSNNLASHANQLDADIDEFLNVETAQPILFAPISTAQSRLELRPPCSATSAHSQNNEDAHEHVDWLRYTVRRMRRQ